MTRKKSFSEIMKNRAAASKGGKVSGESRRKAIFNSTKTNSVGAKYLRASSFLRLYLQIHTTSTLEQMADALNNAGFVTATGSVFHATSVIRLAKWFDIDLPKNKRGRKKKILTYDTPARHHSRTGCTRTRLAGSWTPVDKPVKRLGFARRKHSAKRNAR
jgi:hypothetical protein